MKKYSKIITLFILVFIFCLYPCYIFAFTNFNNIDVNKLDLNSISKYKTDELKDAIKNLTIDENIINNNINSSNIDSTTMETIIKAYEELSSVVSNEEIADFIEDNKDTLSKAGASEAILSASSALLKTFDPETVIDIVQNDLELDKIIEESKSSSSGDILNSVIENTTTSTKVKVTFKLLFSNPYFKMIFLLFIVLMIYSIIISGIIFKKAGKPAFATIIPLYRDIIYLKLYDFSPWLILLLFIPFIGWLALLAIAVIRKI